MDRGAWWATVHGAVKESDMTKQARISELSVQILSNTGAFSASWPTCHSTWKSY